MSLESLIVGKCLIDTLLLVGGYFVISLDAFNSTDLFAINRQNSLADFDQFLDLLRQVSAVDVLLVALLPP